MPIGRAMGFNESELEDLKQKLKQKGDRKSRDLATKCKAQLSSDDATAAEVKKSLSVNKRKKYEIKSGRRIDYSSSENDSKEWKTKL